MSNPYTAPQATAPQATESQLDATSISASRITRAWIGFILLSSACGFLVGAILGGIAGAILGALGTPIETIRLVGMGMGFFANLPISYLFFRRSVKKLLKDEPDLTDN